MRLLTGFALLMTAGDLSADRIGGRADRIGRKVRVACCGGGLSVTEQLADHGKAHAATYGHAGKAVAQVVDAHVIEVCCRPYPPPRLLKVDQARTRLSCRR